MKYRLYMNSIKYGRDLEFGERLGIDFDDISKFPAAVLELYQEKKKHDAFIKRKEEKI